MFRLGILFALLMALLFTAVFTLAFQRRGPWSSVLAFFLVVFLAAWASSLWFSPAGPAFLGIYWVPIILVAFFWTLRVGFAIVIVSGYVLERPPA